MKWFGVCLAVASGLAVGPEGPMIFIGTGLSGAVGATWYKLKFGTLCWLALRE